MTHTDSSRVSSKTPSNKLAGYLAHVFEKGDLSHELNCIGPAAISQASKAVASARGILAPKGIDLAITPFFFETVAEGRNATSEDESRTGIRFTVFKR